MPSSYSNNVSPTDPCVELAAITTSDTVDLPKIARTIYVGAGGNIALIAAGDSSAVTLVAVPGGTILPIRVKRVLVTGTTAASLVAMY
jgi:hypothetical protein